MPTTEDVQPLACPACGGANAGDAIFCANAACGKALGEFPYVLERIAEESTPLERLADRVARVTGRPHFVTAHVLWFAAWVLLNSGVIVSLRVLSVRMELGPLAGSKSAPRNHRSKPARRRAGPRPTARTPWTLPALWECGVA